MGKRHALVNYFDEIHALHFLSRSRQKSALIGIFIIAAMGVIFSLASCSTGNKTAPPPAGSAGSATAPGTNAANPEAPWPEKMKSLSETLSDLLPLVASRVKFQNEKNGEKIEAGTRRLRSLAHSLKAGSAPNADPSMKIMSGLFEEDIERALEGLHAGNREYARQILKDTTSYCIQCHTQTNNGPNFPKLDLKINVSELPPVEQAEFFAATRQFDRSLEAYERALKDPNLAKLDPFEWEQSARSALAIVVRVKNDPKTAGQLLARIQTPASLPASTKTAITAWRKSIQDWSKEKRGKPTSPKGVLSTAEELIKTAQKHQEFPLDHSQDIVYFRAASLLHEFLQSKGSSDDLSARALYLAGIAAEATRDMNFWTLHETYYEQCVRTLPHSKQALECFERLRESVTLGYSGSGGVRIPPEVNRRLENYRAMAVPVEKAPEPEAR